MKLGKRHTRRIGLAVTAAAVAAGCVVGAVSAGAAAPVKQAPVTPGSGYLALGDSISFGYRESNTTPAPDYSKQADFIGFPSIVAADLHLKLANASCPGETSGSLINVKSATFGCERGKTNTGPGYRTAYPLHVSYASSAQSQLDYALAVLNKNKNIRLITLMVGANDGFRCQATTADHCTSLPELQGVLATIKKNVAIILARLRKLGHYTGQIVVVNYYSTDYSDVFASGQSQAVNSAIDEAAQPYNVTVAKSYEFFALAASHSADKTCAAGLLTQLSDSTCGVHPSFAGQAVLATSVDRVVTPG